MEEIKYLRRVLYVDTVEILQVSFGDSDENRSNYSFFLG